MASRQPLLPNWWEKKHTILSAVGGALVIVGIIAAVHFSNTWSVDEVDTFLTKGITEGRFPASEDVESLILTLKANAEIPCAGNRQYIVTNIITMEKVDLQFAPTQALTPAKFLGITTGRWNPLQLMKCDVVTKKPGDDVYVGQVDEEGANHGVGNVTWGEEPDVTSYIGQWDHGAPDGIGEYEHPNRNASYLGQFKAGTQHGEGKYTDKSAGKSYSGEWVNDKMKGMVTITSKNGDSEQKECSKIVTSSLTFEFGCVA
eukprot:640177_1